MKSLITASLTTRAKSTWFSRSLNKYYFPVILIIVLFVTSTYLFSINLKTRVDNQVQLKNPVIKKSVEPTTTVSPINNDNLFVENTALINSLPQEKMITLFAVGDVMLGRSVNFNSISKNDSAWAFNNTSELKNSGDIVIINLESPFNRNCPLINSGMKFCAETKLIAGLTDFGVNVANIANNHIFDQGNDGHIETLSTLFNAGIVVSGSDNPGFMSIKGNTFAFVGFNSIPPQTDVVLRGTKENVTNKVALAKKSSDFVVASFHWGNEYQDYPTANQIDLAHLAIDSGADLVIGNHPHWIQPIEIYKEKPILYSLGNFVFDQMWSQKTREGLTAKFYIYENKVVNLELEPIVIENYGQPRIASENEKQRIMDDIIVSSYLLKLQ